MSAASTAIQAADYATAIIKALAAQALLIAIPDSGWRDGAFMKWRPESVQDFINSARQAQNAAGGIQRTKIQYARTSAPI